MKILRIYTEGGYKKSKNIGSYSYIIVHDGNIIHQYSICCDGKKNNIDNNIMEMTPIIKSLNWLRSNSFNLNDYRVYVYTDSQSTQLGVIENLETWKLNNWKNSNNKEVKYKDLWMEIDRLVTFDIPYLYIQWEKGHENNNFNQYVHNLCTGAMEEYELTTG